MSLDDDLSCLTPMKFTNGEEQEKRCGEWNVDLFELREYWDRSVSWMQRGPAYLRLLVHRENDKHWRIVARQTLTGRVLVNRALLATHDLSTIVRTCEPPAALTSEIIDFHGLEYDDKRTVMVGQTSAIVFGSVNDANEFLTCLPEWLDRPRLEADLDTILGRDLVRCIREFL